MHFHEKRFCSPLPFLYALCVLSCAGLSNPVAAATCTLPNTLHVALETSTFTCSTPSGLDIGGAVSLAEAMLLDLEETGIALGASGHLFDTIKRDEFALANPWNLPA